MRYISYFFKNKWNVLKENRSENFRNRARDKHKHNWEILECEKYLPQVNFPYQQYWYNLIFLVLIVAKSYYVNKNQLNPSKFLVSVYLSVIFILLG